MLKNNLLILLTCGILELLLIFFVEEQEMSLLSLIQKDDLLDWL